ncbi:hypothetical protein MTO96_001762 [Rhipicephalus appendiculatus]
MTSHCPLFRKRFHPKFVGNGEQILREMSEIAESNLFKKDMQQKRGAAVNCSSCFIFASLTFHTHRSSSSSSASAKKRSSF